MYKTIYALDYHGEYGIRDTRDVKQFWAVDEIDRDTFKTTYMWLNKLQDEPKDWESIFKQFVSEKYPELYAVNPDIIEGHIIGIQFREDADTKSIADNLHDQAISTLKEATGDDSFFDYAPGFADMIISFVLQLGHPEIADSIKAFLQSNGHND